MKDSDLLFILADFELVSTENGGRRTPIFKTPYRPNHYFPEVASILGRRTYCIGQIELIENDVLLPGQKSLCKIKFLSEGILEGIIKIGLKWEMFEGNRHVANGHVLQILDTKTDYENI